MVGVSDNIFQPHLSSTENYSTYSGRESTCKLKLVVVHTIAVVSWYSPKISHKDHLDSTIADAPLQALGLDGSLYGYNVQMKYPLLPSWCPSRATGPYNFVESTMHQGKGYIQPYIPIHSTKSKSDHNFVLRDKIISLH